VCSSTRRSATVYLQHHKALRAQQRCILVHRDPDRAHTCASTATTAAGSLLVTTCSSCSTVCSAAALRPYDHHTFRDSKFGSLLSVTLCCTRIHTSTTATVSLLAVPLLHGSARCSCSTAISTAVHTAVAVLCTPCSYYDHTMCTLMYTAYTA
jgi:hypothetical protein